MPIYTNSVPQPTQTVAFTQPFILDNFKYLESVIDEDHNFTSNSVTTADGYHKVIHFVNQSGNPVAITGVSQLYTKTYSPSVGPSDTQLFHITGGGGIAQLTGYQAAKPGYAWVGGMLLQWGDEPIGAGAGTINFTIAFTGNPLWVQTTTRYSSAIVPGNPGNVSVDQAQTPTTFNWKYSGTSATTGFYWLAIGQ